METLFTFPDGVLGYDCASCGQKCCRGKTFTVAGDELVPLVGRAPKVARWFRLAGAGTMNALNLSDKCWFLADSGFCEIETAHGRAAKPSTCKLFPFNRIAMVGDVRIVDLASELCPLGRRDLGIRHRELLADIEALGASALTHNPASLPAHLAEDWLAIERAAQEVYRTAKTADAAALGLGVSDTERLAAEWAALYGVDLPTVQKLEAVVAPDVALLAGSFRVGNIFRPGAHYLDERMTLPLRMRALTFLAALAHYDLGARPSLRALTELWRGLRPQIEVLALWRAPVKIKSLQFGADSPPALEGALGQLLGLGFRGGITVGELMKKVAQTLPEAERPLLVPLTVTQLRMLLGHTPEA